MSMRLFFVLTFSLHLSDGLNCECSGCHGPVQLCAGDYCYAQKIYPDSEDFKTGCITPREDIWVNKTLPLCERNQANSTFCVCDEDMCNTKQNFTHMLTRGPFIKPPKIKCMYNLTWSNWGDLTCQSSMCIMRNGRSYNEFFDLTKAPYTETDRRCPESEEFKIYTRDIGYSTPQMNSCLHIRWTPTSSDLTCICNTPMCNSKIPMYDNLPRRGKGICYLKTKDTETTTCWGDYCFWAVENNRGCIDIAYGSPDFKLRLGESSLDERYIHICEGNYCNSDFMYPNGTIVGPSATRPFTNPTTSLPLTLLLLLALVKLLDAC